MTDIIPLGSTFALLDLLLKGEIFTCLQLLELGNSMDEKGIRGNA